MTRVLPALHTHPPPRRAPHPSTHLRGQALIRSVREEEPDDVVVILLRGHVQRREPVLRLHVHRGPVLHQQLHHVLLSREGRDVQRGVALLGGGIHAGTSLEQFCDYIYVTIFRCQVESV